MAWNLVKNPSAVVETGFYDGSVSASFSSNPTVGNLIVVTGGGGSQSATYTVSDNKSNTYTVRQSSNSEGYSTFIAWAVVATTGSSFTVTATEAGQRDTSIKIAEFSGGLTSGVEDVYALGTPSYNTTATVSATTTAAGDLVVSSFANQNSVALTVPPSGYTSLMGVNGVTNSGFARTIASAYKVAGSAGSETATWPDFDASNQVALMVAFKVGSSGPTVSTVSSNSATEGSSVVHTVTLSAATTASTNFAASLTDGTATGGGTDYTGNLASATYSNGVTYSGGNFVVPSGVSSFTVSIPTTSDTLDEANETWTLTVGGVSGTGTITDDDPLPSISINDVSQSGSTYTFTVTLSAASGRSITVDYATANGSKTAGTDYTAVSGTLTFAPGETSKTVSVTVL